jgi:hypothetical protein
MPELEIRWPSSTYAKFPIGTPLDVLDVSGLDADDLADFADDMADNLVGTPTVTARVSSAGKGASGPAWAVVVEIERYVTDSASLLALGTALYALIRKISGRRGVQAVIEEGRTLGALSVAALEESELFEEADLEMTFVQTVPLTTFPGVGTNLGDVWTTVFRRHNGDLRLVFISPGGKFLGTVSVPGPYMRDEKGSAHERTTEDVSQWWARGSSG